MKLDDAVAGFVESRAIPILGIADVQGFASALPGWHPIPLYSMSGWNTIVVPWDIGW